MKKAQRTVLLAKICGWVLAAGVLLFSLAGCGPAGAASNPTPERRDLRLIEFYSPM
jgi:hypothetical protein